MDDLAKMFVTVLVIVCIATAVYLVDSIGTDGKTQVVQVTSRHYEEASTTYMFNGSTMIPLYQPEVFKLMTPTPCEVTKDIYKTTAVGDKIVVTTEVGLLFKRNKYCTFLRKHHE